MRNDATASAVRPAIARIPREAPSSNRDAAERALQLPARRRAWSTLIAATAILALHAPVSIAAPRREPPRPAATNALRIEVPITQRQLRDGTRRYSVPIQVGNSAPFDAMVDTGSYGLRVLDSALGVGAYKLTNPKVLPSPFGSGVVLNGQIASATVQVGAVQTEQPIAIQVVKSVSCTAKKPHCPASRIPAKDYRIGGNGVAGQGYTAIMGISIRGTRNALHSPLSAMGSRSWIVELPRPTDHSPGKLIINPTAADLAGFQYFDTRTHGAAGRVRLNDLRVPLCTDSSAKNLFGCKRVALDSGASYGVHWFFTYDIYYDAAHDRIGARPRPK